MRLQPQNIHVAQVVIDGGINNPERPERLTERGPDGCLDPDAIAQTYLHLHRQHRSAMGFSHRITAMVGKVLAAQWH